MKQNSENLELDLHAIGGGFTLGDATKLMHHEVIRKADKDKPQTIERIGIVSGVLSINDQIEVVVKFYSCIEQFTEAEFESKLIVTSYDE